MKPVWTIALAIFLLCGDLYALPAQARVEDPPIPAKKNVGLDDVKSRLKEEEQHKKELAAKAQTIKKDLKSTRTDLTKVAKAVRINEGKLDNLATKIRELSAEQQDLTNNLENNYGSIADLILALERIKRIPPEALIVRPGAPYKTAQTALLLKGVLPAVYQKADQLSAQLVRLKELEQNLKEDRAEQIAQQKELADKQKQMAALIKKRESLFSQTKSDIKRTERNMATLAQKAKTLEDLLARVKEENRTQSLNNARNGTKTAKASMPLPALGNGIVPVNGRVLVNYGQTDAIGAKSQGLKIESSPASLITSPLGGVVRFSGEFKNYGNLLIIEHKNGYHSLIAGFGNTSVKPGQAVNAGEPIGKLPYTSSRGGRPTLYYELRYKGQAIDPARKLSKLKS